MVATVAGLAFLAIVVWIMQSDSDSAEPAPTQATLAAQATPPIERQRYTDLAAPFESNLGDTGPLLHLRVEPVTRGANDLAVFVTEPTEQPGQEPVRRPLPPDSAVELILTALNHDLAPITATGRPDDAGGFLASGLDLSGDGWWRVDVRVGPPAAPEVRQSYFLLLPDPNVHGSAAAKSVEPHMDGGEAAALFNRGLTTLAGLHRVRYQEHLADGNGHLVIGDYALSDGTDGRPPALSIRSARTALIRIGDREWLRRGDGEWTERTSASIFIPADFAETYAGATDLRLGRTEAIDGELCRIVTFYVPEAPRRAEAWYAWWVGEETGFVRQEAMVARSHYMMHRFGDFDADFAILPPDATDPGPGTPQSANGMPGSPDNLLPAGATPSPPTDANRTTSRHTSFTARR